MKNNIVRDVLFGMLISIISMCIIAFVITSIFHSYVFDNFRGISKVYIPLLGYGFFGNLALYGLFWYLDKEYVQRGIIIVTMIASFVIIVNRLM